VLFSNGGYCPFDVSLKIFVRDSQSGSVQVLNELNSPQLGEVSKGNNLMKMVLRNVPGMKGSIQLLHQASPDF
jgi:hypothetical protein